MNGQWVKGWNGGLTGPNTPSTPTVAESCAKHAYNKALSSRKPGQALPVCPSCNDYYIPVACGTDTVAIAVGPDREATATLIAKAPRLEEEVERMERALILILSVSHPTIDREIRAIVKEALR
jgi:hypothetical protein